MSAPFEILAAPFDAWLAAANTAEVAVDTTPPVAWSSIGANGADNYDEDGVQVTHESDYEQFVGLGQTGDLKVWRTKEMHKVEFTVYDITAEQYAQVALNDNAVTTTAAASGVPGSKNVALHQGYDVALFALLIRSRGASPYGDNWNLQYWLPVCYQAENPEPTYMKGKPAGLKLSFMGLQDSTNGFGKIRPQTATALP